MIIKPSEKKTRIVFSTDPDFHKQKEGSEEPLLLPPQEQNLRIRLDRIGGGRVVTGISGFVGPQKERKGLGKRLRTLCAAGGSVKGDEILIQGDFREKILEFLQGQGYSVKKTGG